MIQSTQSFTKDIYPIYIVDPYVLSQRSISFISIMGRDPGPLLPHIQLQKKLHHHRLHTAHRPVWVYEPRLQTTDRNWLESLIVTSVLIVTNVLIATNVLVISLDRHLYSCRCKSITSMKLSRRGHWSDLQTGDEKKLVGELIVASIFVALSPQRY